jgi:hypothetical protein
MMRIRFRVQLITLRRIRMRIQVTKMVADPQDCLPQLVDGVHDGMEAARGQRGNPLLLLRYCARRRLNIDLFMDHLSKKVLHTSVADP